MRLHPDNGHLGHINRFILRDDDLDMQALEGCSGCGHACQANIS